MTRILQLLNKKNFYTTKYTKKHEGLPASGGAKGDQGFIFILRDLPGCAGGFAEASRDLRGKNITNRFNLCYPRSSPRRSLGQRSLGMHPAKKGIS